jgi:hypothetical protein
MKILSKVFRGIEYIQTSQLPPQQREKLLETINQKLFIKILIDGKVVGDCLQYKDYEVWYENIYRAPAEKVNGMSEALKTADTKVSVP